MEGSPTRILTGITTTGTPHLGNFTGAIRPAIVASAADGVETFLFLADFHALIKQPNPQRVAEASLQVAASWLACGLDSERVVFYRQSDVPQILELAWLLGCVTAKGLLNRAHAYKALVEHNQQARADPDAGVSAGLFNYPVLMAADILAFSAERVPVGPDQLQHLEIARDIAGRFNHIYGALLTLPEAETVDAPVLPGLDGRKMSKSYDNSIALFATEQQLRKRIMQIRTSSLEPGEIKPTDCALFAIYAAFADADGASRMREAYAEGIGWGEAKQQLFELVNAVLAEPRERYLALTASPQHIEEQLQTGAARARSEASALLQRVREAVGIKSLDGVV